VLTGAEWAGLGVAATLLTGWIAHRIGWIQIGSMREAHALNVMKSTPAINSRVSIAPFHPANRPDVTGYTIHTTIYNDGELVARRLEGEWRLEASHGVNGTVKTIRADSLPAFLPLELNHEITGKVASLWCEPSVTLQVDIELSYLGWEDKPESYQATYDYDFQHRSMVQKKGSQGSISG
jgi:hypothetical protein